MKEEYDFSEGWRGAIDPLPPGKTRITIRLDGDILDWFRGQVEAAGGGNYQTLINAALREYVSRSPETLENLLRRVVREELDRRAFTELAPAERVELALALWDSLAEESSEDTRDEAQREELARRVAAYRRDSAEGASWQAVRERIRSRRQVGDGGSREAP